MTQEQIKNKIEELEIWLKSNPDHPSRTVIEIDLRNLRTQAEKDNDPIAYPTMEEIHDRMELLLLILQFDTEENKHFTIWDRMLINQERASLMDFQNYLMGEIDFERVRIFKVGPCIEEKIETIKRVIQIKNWQPEIREMF